MYPGLNIFQERKLSLPAYQSTLPLRRSPDDFCGEHEGEAASHSTRLGLCWDLQMGMHMGGGRAGKCIYLPLGPICCHLAGRNPPSAKLGTTSQQREGMMRCYLFAGGRLLAATGGEWLSRENSIICEFRRSRASRIAATQCFSLLRTVIEERVRGKP